MIGSHQRAGRRRRAGKAAVIAALLVTLALLLSMNNRTFEQPGKWDQPTRSDLAEARNEYRLAGGPYGNAGNLLKRYQRYAAYITGLVDDPALCGPLWAWKGETKVLEIPAEVSG